MGTETKRGKRKKKWWLKRQEALDLAASERLKKAAADGKGQLKKLVGMTPRYSMGPPPKYKAGRPPAPLKMDKASCLIHGIKPEHLEKALNLRALQSGFAREGYSPKAGKGTRIADKQRGGYSAIYSRVVATNHRVPAKGSSVGGGVENVQLILDPTVLERSFFLASGLDNMGYIQGTSIALRMLFAKMKTSLRSLWSGHTEHESNGNANSLLTSTTWPDHNELQHYQTLPLSNVLKGVVCSGREAFDKMMSQPGAKLMPGDDTRGTIEMAGMIIPVVLTDPEADLVQVLKEEGIANELGQVR